MLRMQPFTTEFPTSPGEAVSLLSRHGADAKLCAGGTDLLPNLKHELLAPKVVVSLARIPSLNHIHEHDDELVIGAMTSLDTIANDALVKTYAPSLADAAHHVAGPQLRRMGTLGGNLCLDTRCLYYNQTYFWREALGFCLKKDGTTCHVTQTGKRCVAAASNDTATVLLCLDASVDIQSPAGLRQVLLKDFYRADGEKNTILEPNELLVAVRVPKPKLQVHRRLEGFAKLRHRESIDFPMLSVGVRFDVNDALQIDYASVTLNALAARPKSIQTDWLHGKTFDNTIINELAQYAQARTTPLTNICDEPTWRKAMVSVYVRKACEKAMTCLNTPHG
jgi:4-hydroxybenzoyl-CoA reductase subunit beta